MGRQLLLPRCYQNTPYQEHLGAPSLTGNPRFFAGIGPLGYAQVGPGTNYESVDQRFESSWAHHKAWLVVEWRRDSFGSKREKRCQTCLISGEEA